MSTINSVDSDQKTDETRSIVNDRTFLLREKPTKSSFSTYRNLSTISLTFLLLYTAYDSMKNLQSSINTNDNLGVDSLAVVHGFFLLSSAFLSHPVIILVGYKWTILISLIPFFLFMIANYFPQAFLMYPIAVLVGLGSGFLWTGSLVYITDIASSYAETRSIDKDVIIDRFIGIFYMCYQSAQIWGNLISFVILSPQQYNHINITTSVNPMKYNNCGAKFDQREYHVLETVLPVDETTFHVLCAIYTCLCGLAIILLWLFLDSRRTENTESISALVVSSLKRVTSTFKQMRHLTQILLIPLTIWSGLEQAFLSGWFTKAFVTCTLNPKYIGLVYTTFGVCASLSSIAVSPCVKIIGRSAMLIVATCISSTLLIFMLVWHPTADQLLLLCAIAGLWGVSEAIWLTQISVLYSLLFPDEPEASLSSYCVWDALGFMLIYIMIPHVRTDVALIFLLLTLLTGMLGYAVIQYREKKSDKDRTLSN